MPRIPRLLCVLIAVAIASAAAAQPEAGIGSSPQVRQACAADGNRLCAGVPRVQEQMARCIRQHWSDLSPPCKSAILARRAAIQAHPDPAAGPPH